MRSRWAEKVKPIIYILPNVPPETNINKTGNVTLRGAFVQSQSHWKINKYYIF